MLRHGETVWNEEGRLQGCRDSLLTARGEAQAVRQGMLLAGLGVSPATHVAWSSPQGRARETARLALGPLGFTPRPDARLGEIDVGAFTGRRVAALRMAHAATFAGGRLDWYGRVPGGEGFAALRMRVEAVLAELDRPAILVTHGMTGRMLRAAALGLADAALGELPGGQGRLFRITDGRERVIG